MTGKSAKKVGLIGEADPGVGVVEHSLNLHIRELVTTHHAYMISHQARPRRGWPVRRRRTSLIGEADPGLGMTKHSISAADPDEALKEKII
ncbi:hypothetical protein ACIP46_40220 [Streptomyces lavendulae]|uniref:hypothetical protein n=1 Tax=Streptomyces lavendulae TaxID=1914 RepID=UPI003803AE90